MVRDLTVDGQNKPFLFSYRAIKELNKAGIKDGLESLERAAFLGFKFGAIKRNLPVDFTEATIEEWFDEDLSLIGDIKEIIEETMADFEKSSGGKKKTLKALK